MKVTNSHHQKGRWPAHSFYIGRPGRIAREEVARGAIDATLFGNPFTLKEHGEDALELYRRHLWNALKDLPGHRQALAGLPPDAVLICSCAPRPCHGEIIIAAWSWLLGKRRRLAGAIRSSKDEGREA